MAAYIAKISKKENDRINRRIKNEASEFCRVLDGHGKLIKKRIIRSMCEDEKKRQSQKKSELKDGKREVGTESN